MKKGEIFLGDVSTQLKNKNITTDVKVDTNSNVSLKELQLLLYFILFLLEFFLVGLGFDISTNIGI